MPENVQDPRGTMVAVRDARSRAIARLSEGFTHDELELEEFEDRLSRAHQFETVAEIESLLADLPSSQRGAHLAPTTTAVVPVSEVRDSATVLAVMSGARRVGQWRVPRRLRVMAAMGGVELDFREAQFPPGVTTVRAMAMMGGVHILVPPNLAVETHGMGIMGGFDQIDRAPHTPDADAPLLRIDGLAIMGGVSVETRLPGESEHDARRRRRRERKNERRQLKAPG